MAKRKYTSQPPNNTGKKYARNVYDPRVDMFKQFYLRPDSYTFFNIRQSALRAGYSEQYACNISTQAPKWWTELVESGDYTRAQMLNKAQDNLLKVVKEEDNGDIANKKIKVDVSKYVTERLGKEHYSTRQEVTGKDGKRLFAFKDDSSTNSVDELFKGVQSAPASSKNKGD